MSVAKLAELTWLSERVESLLEDHRIPASALSLEPCTAGGNNQVYVADTGTDRFVVKRYYMSDHDRRDRLGAEWSLLQYARSVNLTCVPGPICQDPDERLGIYEFVEGRRLEIDEVDVGHVQQAAEFFAGLNGPQRDLLGRDLPVASEACFSLDEQLDLIQGRVEGLSSIDEVDAIVRDAIGVAQDIQQLFAAIREQLTVNHAVLPEGASSTVLVDEDRCISPSDFGFHNALVNERDELTFLDFEYAGWDDPAKMTADFFSHPGVPVGIEHFEPFLDICFRYSPNRERLKSRAARMMPLFRVKWCCIMLNEFLPDAAGRRQFADPAKSSEEWRRAQIEKANHYLKRITH